MDVREKLVDIVCDATQINGCIHSCRHQPCAMVRGIVDALIENGVTMKSECEACGKAASDTIVGLKKTIKELSDAQQWIPVTERMPEKNVDVLVFNGHGFFVAQFYTWHIGGIGLDCWSMPQYCADPTHWMPLPDAPKGE